MRRSILIVKPEGIETFPLPDRGTVSIGRAEGNDIRVDDPSLSRKHGLLHVGNDVRLEDLGGTNPIRIRRRTRSDASQTEKLFELRRETLTVQPGDRILLGSVQLVVQSAEPAGSRGGPVAGDPEMQRVLAEARRVALAPINLLLLGETGAGKEVLAEFIHAHSPRATAPFVAINCAALSDTLFEAELFGHERGAYTGAAHAREGLLETADLGTVFLDEVGELSLPAQAKLLRVLEDQKVLHVGGRSPRQVSLRFIAATNRNLAENTRGGFRSDLYFRLAGATLTVPPLRDRRSDIAPLCHAFLSRMAATLRIDAPRLENETLAALEAYDWPGNVRELKNVMERAVALCSGPSLELTHLPRHLLTLPVARSEPAGPPESPVETGSQPPALASVVRLRSELHEAERQRILDALTRCGGNQTRAAELLGISRRTLLTRLSSYRVPRPRKG